ncbi:MAG: TonB-dependent receptor plug domain-containing protein, partial [Planctomycetota bacterium]
MKIRAYILVAFTVALPLGLSAPAAQAEDPNLHENYFDMSIEQLMQVEITLASKDQQKLFRTPAAAYVITAEDIRRSSHQSIPELLRTVPGLQVARMNANTWAVSARGFNSEHANKLLVMIDGRSVYTPLFGGVHWDMHDVMLED